MFSPQTKIKPSEEGKRRGRENVRKRKGKAWERGRIKVGKREGKGGFI